MKVYDITQKSLWMKTDCVVFHPVGRRDVHNGNVIRTIYFLGVLWLCDESSYIRQFIWWWGTTWRWPLCWMQRFFEPTNWCPGGVGLIFEHMRNGYRKLAESWFQFVNVVVSRMSAAFAFVCINQYLEQLSPLVEIITSIYLVQVIQAFVSSSWKRSHWPWVPHWPK